MDCSGLGRIGCSWCAAWLLLAAPAMTLGSQEEIHVEAGGAFLAGPVQGRVQTPDSGESATTSHHRPTLEELGIDETGAGEFWATVWRGEHGLYLGGTIAHLSGDDTLQTALVTHGVTFPAGALVDAEVNLDTYRFGYRYGFPIEVAGQAVDVYASAGGAMLDFDYLLSSPGLPEVDRSYARLGAQVGLGVRWAFTDEFSLMIEGRAPVPVDHWAQIASIQGMIKYRMLVFDDWAVSGLAGIEYGWISYDDERGTPNDIKADLGPLGLLGLEVTF